MAIRTIDGKLYQKQGNEVVLLHPETCAKQVLFDTGEGDSNVQIVIENIESQIAALEGVAADALVFKGVVNSAADLPTAGYKVGDTYKINTAGTYKGIVCEPGDALIAVAETGADSDWVVLQANIDGAVTGPVSAADGNIAVFDGANGKVIKDSGVKASDVTGAVADLAALTARVTTAEGDIDALEGRMTTAEGDIADLKAADAAEAAAREALAARVTTNEGDIAALKAADTALAARVTTNEGDIADLKAADTALAGRVSTNEADIANLKAADTALAARVTTNEGDIADLKGRVTTNEGDIANLKAADTALAARVTTNEGDIADLKGRMTTAEGDIDAVEAKNDEQDGRLDALEAAVEELEQDLTDAKWVTYVAEATEANLNEAAAGLVNFGLIIAGNTVHPIDM